MTARRGSFGAAACYVLVACSVVACSVPDVAERRPARQPVVSHHIDSADDIRWPIERRSFHGTVREITQHGRTIVMLDIADGGGSDLIALAPTDTADLIADRELSISGIGRVLAAHELAAGAVLSLGDIHIETAAEVAPRSHEPSSWRDLRSRTEIGIALVQTSVTAEGTLVEQPTPSGVSQLALDLAPTNQVPGARLRVLVTPDGYAEAHANVGKIVRVRAYLTFVESGPELAIGQPTLL